MKFYAVVVATLLSVAPAHAVPEAEFGKSVIASDKDGRFRQASSGFDPVSICFGGGCAFASSTDGFSQLSEGPFPSVFAQASFTGGGPNINYVTQAVSVLKYYFTIVGPNGGPVPIIVGGNTRFERQNSGGAIGSSLIYDHQGTLSSNVQFACTESVNTSCGRNVFLQSASFLSFPNSTGAYSGYIEIMALAAAYSNSIENSSSAFVDPLISIDPIFSRSNPGYSVFVSSGIGNGAGGVSGVPEPSTWIILVAGMGLVGWSLRRRLKRSGIVARGFRQQYT